MNDKKARHIEFEQMLRKSHRILYHVCIAFTDRKAESVNDLYQEIVLNLWRGWPEFRGRSDTTSWVYRVALNTAGTELRRRKHRDKMVLVPLNDAIVRTLTEETDPAKELLYELIDKLDDDEKKLLLLYLDRISYAHIGLLTGLSEVTARQRIYRIKKKLVHLKQQEDEQYTQ